MGGAQSGTHHIGDALWVQERQRQKCHGDSNRYGERNGHGCQAVPQERRKLLRRTRSLAVISEDESRGTSTERLGSSCDSTPYESASLQYRRPFRIPRVKPIDRKTLKDRLSRSQQHLSDYYERYNEPRPCHSRPICGIYSLPPPLTTFPEPSGYAGVNCRPIAETPDRLNILKWPDSPRRYRSVQDLNTVSGLVDIVEDNCWPVEENRSVDCIYTQVKRKRKEHRSLDSILFEDDSDDLEYFDILNLLPLSNVRLEADESDASNNNVAGERNVKELPNREPESNPAVISVSTKNSNVGGEKCSKYHPTSRIVEIDEIVPPRDDEKKSKKRKDSEETEESKSLWISDNEEIEEMSRRPQVLKVIDNDVTKPKNLKKSENSDFPSKEQSVSFKENISENGTTNHPTYRVANKPDLINDHIHEAERDVNNEESEKEKERLSVESARSFFENKNSDCHNEGRFERIVKETTNILGKACNAVKGSLGFEARSESSDLGLGSEIGSDVRRLSVDENTNEQKQPSENDNVNDKNQKNLSSLTRSRSCIDSIECQDSDEPEFDHVRYKIVKSNVFSKNIFNNSKKDVTYEGLMQYLREYSFQNLLMDNNVVIIEPVRAEVERKPSFNESKIKSTTISQINMNSLKQIKNSDANSSETNNESKSENHFTKASRQSSLRKHFFYQPIRVNRELNDDELPDPDTVRNVRRMFEETMKNKLIAKADISRDCSTRKSLSMKDLSSLESQTFECRSEKAAESSRSRCSSRAKDLTKMFENLEKTSSPASINENKDDSKVESKTRIIAQSFEARSGQSSPSNSNSFKTRVSRYHQRPLPNWDSGSVSSGVSSDYPDTDAGSAPHCTSSEDEDLYCQEDDGVDERYEGHYVSQDVLKKIREYGTSVTYYGGKVVNTCNGPLICPMVCKKSKNSLDYIKFRLVKSNSCDSRLELTGRVVDRQTNVRKDKRIDLRQFTIDETPSIEITSIEQNVIDEIKDNAETKEEKREPPVVIGLEPKKEENKTFKADFKLGKLEDCTSINRFMPSALTRWQINENTWKRTSDFGKMEFEEFEVLEDSLNGPDN